MKKLLKRILYKIKIIRIFHSEIIGYNKIRNNKNKLSFYSYELKKDIILDFNNVENKEYYLKKNTTPLFFIEKILWFTPVEKMTIVFPKKLTEKEFDKIWNESSKEIEDLLDGAVD